MRILIVMVLYFLSNISKANTEIWTIVTQAKNGHEFYIDTKTIIEKNNFIYFWQLINYKKKDEYGDMSARIYIKGHCKSFQFKWLRVAYHKLLMAKDKGQTQKPSKIVAGWQKPVYGTTSYKIIDYVCSNKGILL